LDHTEKLVEDLRGKLNDNQKKIDLLTKDNGALEDKVAFVEGNNSELALALKMLNENFDALTKEYSLMNDNHGNDKSGYEEKYRDILAKKEDCEHSNEELAKEVNRLWQELNTSEQSQRKADDNLLIVTKEKSVLEAELRELRIKCTTLQFEVTRTQDKSSRLSSQLDEVNEELKDSKSLVEDLRSNMSAISNKDVQLTLEKNALEAELRKAEKSLEQKASGLVAVSEKCGGLESEIKYLEDKVKDTRAELEKHTMFAVEAEDKNKDLVMKMDKLEATNVNLKDENVSKDHDRELVNKDISYLNSLLAAKFASALASSEFKYEISLLTSSMS
jgi:chromosome segregation ATPase